MKIVSVCKVYPTQRPGGMGFVCQDRARELARQGHDVHVLTTGFGPNAERVADRIVDDRGVEVHCLPCRPETYSDEFARECASTCWRLQPDIIHLDSFDNRRPWWQELENKCTIGITMHGFCWGAWMTKVNLAYRDMQQAPTFPAEDFERERRFLNTANRVIGISLHEHWLLRQMMGLFDAKLVYNPIAPYFFSETTQVPPVKKPRWMCAAISGHRERGFHIATSAADRLGLDIVHLSSVPREQMPALIDSCYGLILPTAYAQGLDLTVGETIARARAVVVTATGSYLRESEYAGAYHGSLMTIPLIDQDNQHLLIALNNPHMSDRRDALVHKPANHVRKWLEVMQ